MIQSTYLLESRESARDFERDLDLERDSCLFDDRDLERDSRLEWERDRDLDFDFDKSLDLL